MIVTFLSPSSDHPVGGVIAVFEFANAFARLGHDVHLAHVPFLGLHARGLDDVAWSEFEPSIRHHFLDAVDVSVLPETDFLISAIHELPEGAPGLPLVFVMGQPKLLAGKGGKDPYDEPCPKICIAKWLVDLGVERGIPRQQLAHVPLGIRHDIFRSVVPADQRQQQIAFRYSRFPTKHPEIALRTLELVHQQCPSVTVKAFGTPVPEHLPSWMTFGESVPTEALVHDFYNTSSIFLCTSSNEGFGMPSLEAMACGCALVTVANGGSREFAIDGETALVCDTIDADTIADRILALLRDDDLRIALAQRGREYAAQFTWDNAGKRLEAYLRDYGAAPSAFGWSAA